MKYIAAIFVFFVAQASCKVVPKGKAVISPVAPAPVTEGQLPAGWDQGWEIIMNLATNIQGMLPKNDKDKPYVDAPEMVNKLKSNMHQMAVKINEYANKIQEEAKNMQGSMSSMMKESADKMNEMSKKMMTPEIQKQAQEMRNKLSESIQMVTEEMKKLGFALKEEADEVQGEFVKLTKSTLDSTLKMAQEMTKDMGKKQ